MSEENVPSRLGYRELVGPNLGAEQLEVVGRFIRYDPWPGGAGDIAGLLGLAESLFRSARGQNAHRLPRSFLLAVTSNKVHFFKYRRKKSGLEIRGEVLVLDREAARFVVGKETLTFVASEGGQRPTWNWIAIPSMKKALAK